MIICITGTPGTGKTSVSENLDDFEVLDLTNFIKDEDLGSNNSEIEVGIEELVDALNNEVSDKSDLVVDGHLSHHLECDYCVVLRCQPPVLEERLSERGYRKQKIHENVEAEKLDLILSEAVAQQSNIIEIDTTSREAEDVASEIIEKVENGETGFGGIDWSDYI